MARRRIPQEDLNRLSSYELRTRVRQLESELMRLGMKNADLTAELDRVRQPSPAARALAETMADKEMVELHRRNAWLERPNWMKLWNDEAKDFAIPEGWPQGIDPESYIARQIGVAITYERVVGDKKPADAPQTFLHDMLRRA